MHASALQLCYHHGLNSCRWSINRCILHLICEVRFRTPCLLAHNLLISPHFRLPLPLSPLPSSSSSSSSRQSLLWRNRQEFKNRARSLEYLSGIITDLFVDWHRLQGVDARRRIGELQRTVLTPTKSEDFNFDGLIDAFFRLPSESLNR